MSTSFAYTVKSGDTLYKIAKENNISLSQLAKANGLNEKQALKVGQNIKIPADAEVKNVDNTNPDIIKRNNKEKRNIKTEAFTPVTEKNVDNSTISTKAKSVGSPVAVSAKTQKYSKDLIAPVLSSTSNNDVIQLAMSLKGSRYIAGGSSRGGFDCSGFTTYVYNNFGIKLPRTSASQATAGKHVEKKDLKEGDLVLFATRRSTVSHVGIYIGNGKFIHAANSKKGVTVDSLNSGYYQSTYVGARRIK